MELYSKPYQQQRGKITDVQDNLHSKLSDRKCISCEKRKPIDEFYIDKRHNYISRKCKKCKYAKVKQSVATDRRADVWIDLFVGNKGIIEILKPYFD